jgi:hypothetical protein
MFCHQFKFVTICQLHDFNSSDFVWIETEHSYIIPAMNKMMIWMWLYHFKLHNKKINID